MASKRSRHHDDPPSPDSSSSDEDEQKTSIQSPNFQNHSESEPESASSDSDINGFIAKPIINNPPIEKEEEDGEKKGLFDRVWSLNDEIVLLQSMIDFKEENEKDPSLNQDDFYDFVKHKLSNGKFNKTQVMSKMKRLKKKYKNNLGRSKNGKDPEFLNTHEFKAFKLSKIFWGNLVSNKNDNNVLEGDSDSEVRVNVLALTALADDNVVKVVKRNNGKVKSVKKMKVLDKTEHVVEDDDMIDVDNKMKGFGVLYPHLMKAFDGENGVPKVPMLEGLKGCLNMVDKSTLEEWNKKWKDLHLAEMDAYLNRVALVKEQANWFSNAIKSSDS